MMRLALQHCFAEPSVHAVLIDPLASNVAAQRFYRRIGFADVGLRDFDADRCLVMWLDRDR
jgi:aminoglycoside 6'-N-acetyltransferase